MENKQVPATANTYADQGSFEMVQRMAKALSESDLVPKAYQKNIPNTMIALEMANRIGASPIMVMQNLNVIQGKPSWSSTFIIAVINSCGKFSEALRFKVEGTGENRSCFAFTKNLNGDVCESPVVSMAMAKAEGWLDKPGSKWKTMPDLMIRYRAAAFFGRLYCPELLMGMQSEDEILDVGSPDDELMSHGQWAYITSLLMSTTLSEERRTPINDEIEGKVTVSRAKEIIELLLNNQVATFKEQLQNDILRDESDFDFYYSQLVRYDNRVDLDAHDNAMTDMVKASPYYQEARHQRIQEVGINKPVATVNGI